MAIRVGVISGYWSTNIGNSFFQLAAEYLIRTATGHQADIFLVADQAGYWNTRIGNPRNALSAAEILELDYLVLSGPVFRPEYARILLETLKELSKRQVKVILLSAGMMDYSSESTRLYRDWLREAPFFAMTTRDRQTYELLQGCCDRIYNGIDIAFFVSDFHAPAQISIDKFIVLNFDKSPEPRIETRKEEPGNPRRLRIEFEDEMWSLQFPPFRTWLSNLHWSLRYLNAFWPDQLPSHIEDYVIMRTEHRFNPVFTRKVYKGPNSFASDTPDTYLDLYANTALTLSNRVHACVATLAWGNPAMLFSKTPRSKLFDRMGLEDIKEYPLTVNVDHLQAEKESLLQFLTALL